MDTQETDFNFQQTGSTSTSGRSDAEQLKSALQNEKAAPEVLQYETDLIARIEQNLDYQVHRGRRERRHRLPAAALRRSCHPRLAYAVIQGWQPPSCRMNK